MKVDKQLCSNTLEKTLAACFTWQTEELKAAGLLLSSWKGCLQLKYLRLPWPKWPRTYIDKLLQCGFTCCININSVWLFSLSESEAMKIARVALHQLQDRVMMGNTHLMLEQKAKWFIQVIKCYYNDYYYDVVVVAIVGIQEQIYSVIKCSRLYRISTMRYLLKYLSNLFEGCEYSWDCRCNVNFWQSFISFLCFTVNILHLCWLNNINILM